MEKQRPEPEDLICYVCGVEDPIRTRFDEDRHYVCTVCNLKLWELCRARVDQLSGSLPMFKNGQKDPEAEIKKQFVRCKMGAPI
jgi:hypothetical protein